MSEKRDTDRAPQNPDTMSDREVLIAILLEQRALRSDLEVLKSRVGLLEREVNQAGMGLRDAVADIKTIVSTGKTHSQEFWRLLGEHARNHPAPLCSVPTREAEEA